MTVSLAAVFIPIVFMGGVVGRLLHEFAVTIIIAILFSGVISVTLTPMLCARMLRAETGKAHNAFYRFSERSFNRLQKTYTDSLNWSLEHKRVILGLFVASLVASGVLFKIMPQDFLPSDDTGMLRVSVQAANGTSYERMVAYARQVGAIIDSDPDVEGGMVRVGSDGAGANSADISVMLKPYEERRYGADDIARHLRARLNDITGINVFVQNPPSIRIGGRGTRSSYQYTLQGLDITQLQDVSTELVNKLKTVPGFVGVNSDFDRAAPSVEVKIDRDRAAALGVTPAQIENAMGYAFGGQQVSQIYASSDQYLVMLELLPQYQRNPSSLRTLYITSSNGNLVPLSAVTRQEVGTMPLSINHSGQVPSVTVSFDLAAGYSLSDAVTGIEKASREIGVPSTIQGSFQGTAGAFQDSTANMPELLLIAIVVVYIVLGILYESFIHPLTILSGLPSAAVGALLTLFIAGLPLTLYAFVGMIMLIGIVKKNAIMMIDFALHRQRNDIGVSPEQAIREAAIIRFRPIMMTTMAAMMGTLPIAFGSGVGAESRRPLGLCVAGGLLLSQLLTLYITPVIYTYLDRLSTRLSPRRSSAPKGGVPAPAE
jgi:HAE1 family hydrophobic/amphiphilic exporter-1